ncbi:MAG: 5-methyltetrahydropteroyltriglutamate/homocysteine S-methyltransferase [Deltaproteobacteria bacterium]|nr:5-methyltetrahydropteroyltriglutamate/homocysteine S-methyltransferase [Deltaproteobacteria bacterium]
MPVETACLGYPRIGIGRELKKAQESYWAGKSPAEALLAVADGLRIRHWTSMKSAGIDHIPGNDLSLYDHMLDMAAAAGAVPERYRRIPDPLVRYFAMARGMQDRRAGIDVAALDMTKWFDTNYHYIVPELEAGQAFRLDASRILAELDQARAGGIGIRPVVPGPVTFLMLSRFGQGVPETRASLDRIGALVPVYEELLGLLAARGVAWVQVDEPCLVLDLDARAAEAYRFALGKLAACKARPRVLVATYFGSVEHNLPLFSETGCDGLHVDLARAPGQLEGVLAGLPPEALLSLGVVDGRNVWRTDLDAAHLLVRRAMRSLGGDRLLVAPSCSLLHAPVDLAAEKRLDPGVKGWLAFAEQKLVEVRALADAANTDAPAGPLFEEARAALAGRRASPSTRNPEVRARTAAADASMMRRTSPFGKRIARQEARFGLPPLPTTTIGSFPQTAEIRAVRSKLRQGLISAEEYDRFLRDEVRKCVELQERLGLDVLVHGEFERNDMVEFFGERLEGFAFTENGWVQSYGSRCVKPPVLFGDVSRPDAMTVDWSRYAQSLTRRPVKGILTGPVTILQWSFVRDDMPRGETCRQIALALRDEVADLEAAGIGMIQVDEPAIREGLPLRRGDRPAYLRWAVDAFRLATAGVRDETQVHTHLCYSEFGDILEAIVEMDADVLSIESSRSGMLLLSDFARCRYPNFIGPGVYDIHSPRVPTSGEMEALLARAAESLPPERLWVNPDCGLKTRGWPEVEAALANMVEAARRTRLRLGSGRG